MFESCQCGAGFDAFADATSAGREEGSEDRSARDGGGNEGGEILSVKKTDAELFEELIGLRESGGA